MPSRPGFSSLPTPASASYLYQGLECPVILALFALFLSAPALRSVFLTGLAHSVDRLVKMCNKHNRQNCDVLGARAETPKRMIGCQEGNG